LKRLRKKPFRKREFIIVSEVKYKLEHHGKDGSKQLPISDTALVTLFWIKYNKNKKIQRNNNVKKYQTLAELVTSKPHIIYPKYTLILSVH